MANKLIKIITQEEFEKLFSEAYKMEKKAGKKVKRDRIKAYRIAMLLAFEGGMRISEIVGFKGISKRKNKKTGEVIVKDTSIPPLIKEMVNESSIKIVLGKGQKDRMIPRPKRLNQNALDMLPLINYIKRRALQDFVTNLGKHVLNKEISFHTFRHGCFTHLANKNRPLHEIQMLAGHARLSTTGVYLHANPKQAIDGAREVF